MSDHILLVMTLLVLCAAFAFPRFVRSRSLVLRTLWSIASFAMLTLLLRALVVSPLFPQFQSLSTSERFWEKFAEAGWWISFGRSAILILRLFISVEGRTRETQIIADLFAGTVYVATAFAVVTFVLQLPIGGLVATSGVIAIVLGLALQSTLSDVFSGIAVGIERPYNTGDLIWVEGGIEGHVTQVNWRSTHVATGQNNIAIVPNSIIAKSRIINQSLPTPTRGDALQIVLDAGVTQERCVAALTAAIRACRLPLTTPLPSVTQLGLRGDGATYEISFSVPSSEKVGAVQSEVYAQVQRHLLYAGIPLAVAGLAKVPRMTILTPGLSRDWGSRCLCPLRTLVGQRPE